MTDRELVTRIARSAGGKAGYKQLVRELGLAGGRERRLLLEQLARLTVRGTTRQAGPGALEHPQAAGHARQSLGRPPRSASRWLWVRAAQSPAKPQGSEDIFIPPNEINGAMQGDQVLVEVEPPKADGRRQGRIVRVLERKNPTVVGIFHYARVPIEPSGHTRCSLRRAHDAAHPNTGRACPA